MEPVGISEEGFIALCGEDEILVLDSLKDLLLCFWLEQLLLTIGLGDKQEHDAG